MDRHNAPSRDVLIIKAEALEGLNVSFYGSLVFFPV